MEILKKEICPAPLLSNQVLVGVMNTPALNPSGAGQS